MVSSTQTVNGKYISHADRTAVLAQTVDHAMLVIAARTTDGEFTANEQSNRLFKRINSRQHRYSF